MGHSVEALLDPATDAWIRAQWQALDDVGVAGQARHTGASNRPHVTFAWAQAMPDDVERALVAALDGVPDGVGLPVRLGGLVLFPRRGASVLARLVVPDEALLRLHRLVVTACAGAPGLDAHVLPGAWTPHVTLSRRVPADELGRAVAAVAVVPHDAAGWVDDGDPAAAGSVGAGSVGAGSWLSGLRRWDGDARREWPLR